METKVEKVEVPIEKGIKDKMKIVIEGHGNEHPEYRTGDLIVVVEVMKHKRYERLGDNLKMTKKISLIESLTGFEFNLKHISDLDIKIKTPKGKLIRHGDVMVI